VDSTQRARLSRLYENAIYEVAFPGGWMAFRVGAEGAHTDPFVLITAHNPSSAETSPAENGAANRHLAQVLQERGWPVLEALGRSPDASHVEPSFAVFDIPLLEVLALARAVGQAAVFVWDGATGTIAWCDDEP
jgi:Protein of unknown function (DUF3293)